MALWCTFTIFDRERFVLVLGTSRVGAIRWTTLYGHYFLEIPYELIETTQKMSGAAYFSLSQKKTQFLMVSSQKYINWYSTISQTCCSVRLTLAWERHFSFSLGANEKGTLNFRLDTHRSVCLTRQGKCFGNSSGGNSLKHSVLPGAYPQGVRVQNTERHVGCFYPEHGYGSSS